MNKRDQVFSILSNLDSYKKSVEARKQSTTFYIHGGAAYRLYYGNNAPSTPDIDYVIETTNPQFIPEIKTQVRKLLNEISAIVNATAKFSDTHFDFNSGKCVFIGLLIDTNGSPIMDVPVLLVRQLTPSKNITSFKKVPVIKKLPLVIEQLSLLTNINSTRPRNPLTRNIKYKEKVNKNIQRVRAFMKHDSRLLSNLNRTSVQNALTNLNILRSGQYFITPPITRIRALHQRLPKKI